MAWISNAVLEKGAEGRRWLSKQGDASNNEFADDHYEGEFSRNNTGLWVYMRHTKGKLYHSLRVMEIESNTLWVGDGSTKIRASFPRDPKMTAGKPFRVHEFAIVFDPTAKPERRVTLHIHKFSQDKAGPPELPTTRIEHQPEVQRLLNQISRSQAGQSWMSSPLQSQASSLPSPASPIEDFGTQAEFSTQLPRYGAITGTPRPPVENLRDKSQTPAEPQVHEERSKNVNYLIAMAPKPRKKISTKTVAAQISPTVIRADSEVFNEEVANPQVPQGLPLQKITKNVPTEDNGNSRPMRPPRSSTSPTRPALDQKHGEYERISARSINDGSDDAELLGDSEKENAQRDFVAINPITVSTTAVKIGLEPPAARNESNIGGSEDNPYRGLKKIPRRWLKIPKDQQAMLGTEDAWVNPRLPESVLQERIAHFSMAAEETRRQGVDRNNESSTSESDSVEDSDEGKSDEDEEHLTSAEQQQIEIAPGRKIAPEVENISGRDTESRQSSPIAEEPQRSYSIHSSLEIDQPNEMRSVPSSRRNSVASLASNEPFSWSPSPDRDVDHEKELSVVPESSLPMMKNSISTEQRETPRMVQVLVSNPIEEEELDEEEMELAEPSALSNAVSETQLIRPNYQFISTAIQSSATVQVERTPYVQIPGTFFQHQRLNPISADSSPPIVVPATAEEDQGFAEATNGSSVPTTQEDSQSSSQFNRPDIRIEQNNSEPRSRTTSRKPSPVNATVSRVSQSDTQPSLSQGDVHSAGVSVRAEPQSPPACTTEQVVSPPPAKWKHVATTTNSMKFTPGAQNPADLENLKESNRDEFLHENTSNKRLTVPAEQLLQNDAVPHNSAVDPGEGRMRAAVERETLAVQKEASSFAKSDSARNEDTENDLHESIDEVSLEEAPHGSPTYVQNIYEQYQKAYPNFNESKHSFIRACVYIEWLTYEHLMPLLWDDFVQKFCRDYPKYVADSAKPPLTAIKWYNAQNDIAYQKAILNRDNLDKVFALDPEKTEAARKLFRKGGSRKSEISTQGSMQVGANSNNPLETESMAHPPQLPISQTPNASGSMEIPSVQSAVATKKRSLPWISSPQSDKDDAPPSKKRKSENNGPENDSRATLFSAAPERRNPTLTRPPLFSRHRSTTSREKAATNLHRQRADSADEHRVSTAQPERRNGEASRVRKTSSPFFNRPGSATSREKAITSLYGQRKTSVEDFTTRVSSAEPERRNSEASRVRRTSSPFLSPQRPRPSQEKSTAANNLPPQRNTSISDSAAAKRARILAKVRRRQAEERVRQSSSPQNLNPKGSKPTRDKPPVPISFHRQSNGAATSTTMKATTTPAQQLRSRSTDNMKNTSETGSVNAARLSKYDEKARQWFKNNPNRRRTTINLEESEVESPKGAGIRTSLK